ncbi:chondroitin sulfate synthase 1 isoform X2 [Cylas formicarius]|uniref:chondroitin sulfate synthase 1 isoform X2 n=1 Tax=Cylas formicarius TaxID=197179 RepID=UPI0029586E87|nr:chondroitin sulfate synthase 1 isoform X2 [Cylas formicarius]
MAKPKKLFKILLGVAIGLAFSYFFASTGNTCGTARVARRVSSPEPPEPPPNQNLIFVGVMTAKKYLDTRARAVYDTWGRHVPGRLVFFSSETSYSDKIPLVALRDVDDSYPPQRKSFKMLKYMYEHYVDKYEWFMRADDDVYVRYDKLEELLRGVDSKKPLFIGQTGKGKSEEMDRLSLDTDENFCMGGPGVIMSRGTLRKIAPYLEDCLSNLYTTHEDVEVGRCVRKYAGISCTWSYEMQVIFYHNQSGEAAFTGDLKQKEVHRAITLHPVKHPRQMVRLHNYINGLKVQDALQSSLLLHRDIVQSMAELGYRMDRLEHAQLAPGLELFPRKKGQPDYLGDSGLLGVPVSINRYQPRNLGDVLEWELISKTLYSHRDLNPRKRIGSSLKEGLGDVIREIMEQINSYSKQRGRVIDFKEILYGYWRLDPVHGADLILDLLLVYKKYRGHKMTVQVRRHAYVQQTFTGIFVREATPAGTETSASKDDGIVHQIISKLSDNLAPLSRRPARPAAPVINLLLPLSGRHDTFVRFLDRYVGVCVAEGEPTRLHVIVYAGDDYDATVESIRRTRSEHGLDDDALALVEGGAEPFARGAALQKAVDRLRDDDLMLFVDVDMAFDRKSLDKMRRNAVRGLSVYFPIVYSLYNPKLIGGDVHQVVDGRRGFWRQFGFGIAALYKGDYDKLGGFDLHIKGWGYEDVAFFDKAVASGLKIARSADPGLVHVYHEVRCGAELDAEQRTMCLGTKGNTLGSLATLQALFDKYRRLFR